MIKGQRIAVIGATQVLDDNLITAWTATDTQGGLASAKEVPAARRRGPGRRRATNDTVVVFLHWGVEKQTCPSQSQQELARTLVDAGADIVVGSDAHRLLSRGPAQQCVRRLRTRQLRVLPPGGPGTETGVLKVTATGRDIEGYEFSPAVIRQGVPRPLDGDAAAAATSAWNQLRGCTGLAP